MSAKSWESWEEFIEKTGELESIQPIEWKLPDLVTNSFAAENARKEIPKNVICGDIARLLEKETAAKKV